MRLFFACAFACALSVAVVGCGGDDSNAPATPIDSGVDATPIDAAVADAAIADSKSDATDAAKDAPTPVEQDPNAYPANHHPIPQVDNLGGPLLDHPKLVTVTFAGDPLRDQLRTYVRAIGATPWYAATVGSYGIAEPTILGEIELADTLQHSTMADADFQAYVAQQVAAGTLPPPDAQTLFLFFLPAGLILDAGGTLNCRDNGGYHWDFGMNVPRGDAGADAGATVVDVAYAILPRCQNSLSSMTFITSHELAEAATDPVTTTLYTYNLVSNDAWMPVELGGLYGEIGDLCDSFATTESGYSVQRIWSNKAAALSKHPCQPTSKPYYGAAVRTTPRLVGGKMLDGHLAVKRGQSLDAVVDVFSEAALPNDFTIAAFEAKPYAQVTSLPSGVHISFSKTSVHNGNGVLMTITIGATVTSQSIPVFIRSTLSSTDHNDWPIILTIL